MFGGGRVLDVSLGQVVAYQKFGLPYKDRFGALILALGHRPSEIKKSSTIDNVRSGLTT